MALHPMQRWAVRRSKRERKIAELTRAAAVAALVFVVHHRGSVSTLRPVRPSRAQDALLVLQRRTYTASASRLHLPAPPAPTACTLSCVDNVWKTTRVSLALMRVDCTHCPPSSVRPTLSSSDTSICRLALHLSTAAADSDRVLACGRREAITRRPCVSSMAPTSTHRRRAQCLPTDWSDGQRRLESAQPARDFRPPY